MHYLKRTRDYKLTYKRSEILKIIGFSDSDFAGCRDSKRSTSCHVFMLARGAISWKFAKKTLVASSTMAAKLLLAMRHLTMVYGYETLSPSFVW